MPGRPPQFKDGPAPRRAAKNKNAQDFASTSASCDSLRRESWAPDSLPPPKKYDSYKNFLCRLAVARRSGFRIASINSAMIYRLNQFEFRNAARKANLSTDHFLPLDMIESFLASYSIKALLRSGREVVIDCPRSASRALVYSQNRASTSSCGDRGGDIVRRAA